MEECQRGVFLQMNYSRAWKRRRLSATVRLMIFPRNTRSYRNANSAASYTPRAKQASKEGILRTE